MNESRVNDDVEPTASQRRGGVHAIADVIEEFMEQYLARFSEWTAVVPAKDSQDTAPTRRGSTRSTLTTKNSMQMNVIMRTGHGFSTKNRAQFA